MTDETFIENGSGSSQPVEVKINSQDILKNPMAPSSKSFKKYAVYTPYSAPSKNVKHGVFTPTKHVPYPHPVLVMYGKDHVYPIGTITEHGEFFPTTEKICLTDISRSYPTKDNLRPSLSEKIRVADQTFELQYQTDKWLNILQTAHVNDVLRPHTPPTA